MKIGILGFQGAVIEHQRHIEQLGQEAVVVRYKEQLAEIVGIILPGVKTKKTFPQKLSDLTRIKFRRQVLIYNEKSASYKKCGFQTDKDHFSKDEFRKRYEASFGPLPITL